MTADGRSLKDYTLDEMDAVWNAVKKEQAGACREEGDGT